MKKALKIALILVVVLVLALLAVGFFMGSIIKGGVETFGPRVAKVEMRLDSANLSILSGSGTLKGVFVGNPDGFNAPSAIKVGEVTVAIKPGSIFSDKVVVQTVHVISPDITLFGLKGDNLQKILANVQASTGGSSGTTTNQAGQPSKKKIEVDDFLITGGKLNVILPVLGTVPVALPEIHLTDLGKGLDGLTPSELTAKVLQAVLNSAISAAADAGKGVSKEAGKQLDKVTKGIGNLFK